MNKKILLAALLACAFAPALAGEMGFDEEQVVERRIVTRTGGELQAGHPDAMNFVDAVGGGATMVHMSRARMIKNAPYSAEMVSERTQTLGDGNQIVRKTSTMSYRDSAGRTRTEVRGEDGELRTVTIHDPVEGVRYVLRPRDKTAIKVSAPNGAAMAAVREQARAAAAASAAEARVAGAQARLAADQARTRIEELRREGKLPEGERFIIKQVERSGSKAGEHKDVQIRIAQVAGPQAAARVAPVLAGALGDHKWAGKAETKDLGTREFNGVKATGVQRSYEIPAGEIGNRSPIVVSTETWTAPELQAVVYQKRSDPRSGEFVYRADNLKREEPAAALFTVPSDYTVKDSAALAREAAEKAAAARAKAGRNG
ncbi:hypothetical protein [Massilia sp. LC238]|uniref:hypothetical protein n=1 Tax=Massilia sp. LC238 TaxID=1502852 RepID=UPI0004E3081D|nr:hypothetical protein [Massilia sp. LC238]KFC73466.1 hypothetical protein FG94_01244 [Massilia sp. LC238]